MKLLLTLCVFMLLSSAHASAYQFKHFKLTKSFEEKLKNDKDLSPVLDRVWDKLKDEGLKQVNKLTYEIIDFNQRFNLGEINAPDLVWSAAIDADLGVVIGRRVEPTLDSDRWRVNDQLEVSVEATAFLKKMRDAGEIEISQDALKLFAGVKFSRRYTYQHFATSYLDGLKSNLQKLLLGFNYFRLTNFTDIEDGDVITKEDYLSANVEFSVSTPSMYFMAGYGKGSIYYSKLGTVSYHKPLPEHRYGELDTMRMTYNVTKLTGAAIQLGIQADFYELLNLTFLGAEYKLNYTQSSTTNMTFGDQDLIDIKTDYNLEAAFSKINRGKDPQDIASVQEYITSKEEGNRVSEELNFFAFMWGKYVGNATEELVFEANNTKNYLYRHSQEKANLVKSWWDAIVNADNVNKFKTRMIDNMVFEYQAYDPELPFESVYLNLPANISFRLSKEYTAKKDNKSYVERAKKLISEFKNLEGDILGALDSGDIKAPLNLDLNAQVGSNGIHHLLEKDEFALADAFEVICVGKIVGDDDLSKSEKKCLGALNDTYNLVSHNYQTNHTIHLASLEKFFQAVSKYSKSFADLKVLFDESNVQLYGYLTAKTENKVSFKTYFKDGDSQGNGVIKDFVRSIK